MSLSTHIVLVDPDELFREGLRRLLTEAAFRVSKGVSTLDEALEYLRDKPAPALLLLSVSRGHGRTAADVQRFKTNYPQVRVVVLSERCEFDSVIAVLRAGANGFVLKCIDYVTLAKSLRLVMEGQSVLSSSVIDLFVGRLEPGSRIAATDPSVPGDNMPGGTVVSDKFSSREVEILDCLTRGDANKLIARKFDVAEATVKVHIKAILRKIRVANRTQAAIWAQQYLFARSKSGFDADSRGDGISKDGSTTEAP
jgi:two-component system nitrate/nitrite response regulator NarL